jgi:hypothetical protein
MKRTTIFVPETLERDLQLYARREGRAVASVVREAIQAYIVSKHAPGVVPSFAGVGDSGRSDIAERHEALLFRDLDPHGGERTTTRARSPNRRKR